MLSRTSTSSCKRTLSLPVLDSKQIPSRLGRRACSSRTASIGSATWQSPAVAEMTASIPHPYPSGAVEPFIFAMRKGNALGEHMVLAVTPRERPNELIGMIGAHKQASGVPFIGYWLGTPHWGKGYATEAVQGLIDSLFSLIDLAAIEADTRVINPASRRVLATMRTSKVSLFICAAQVRPVPYAGERPAANGDRLAVGVRRRAAPPRALPCPTPQERRRRRNAPARFVHIPAQTADSMLCVCVAPCDPACLPSPVVGAGPYWVQGR